MTPLESAILGIVEGITEFLPVSSTGHLILTQRLLGLPDDEASKAFAICIQGGAILAVLGLYWKHVAQMFRGLVGRDAAGRTLLINLMAAFIPAMVLGLTLNKPIKQHLFGLWPIVAAWFAGGVAILWVSGRKGQGPRAKGQGEGEGIEGTSDQRTLLNPKSEIGNPKSSLSLHDLTWRMALIIGLAQCVAMWPGVSRSLITIVAGVLVGLRLSAAVEFSFLLGVITLGAATCYDGYKHGSDMLREFGPANLALGFLFAFISAVVAIKWMVAYLNSHGMHLFGYYRVALAAIVAAMLLTKVITA